ncbi:MAG: sugar transferase [Akkermansiaceae bacterium]|nr:sugar transferase [Akkermansiaceae bacterium]NNM29743.1 sugar transferase [Akkermansiaceae bacterium]
MAANGAGAVPRWKRCLDLTGATLGALAVAPLMAGVALWIRLVSKGPVFFHQERVGLNGEEFTLYKFRTMSVSADTRKHEEYVQALIEDEERPLTKMDELGDPRMIPGAALLRSLGLDELPQLVNVWRGEMSLVGPRPCLPAEASRYRPKDRERFTTLPGLTGYWQVRGKNRTTFSEMMAMDIHYARNKSLWMDLGILLRTPLSVLCQTVASLAPERFPLIPAGRARDRRRQ